MYDHLLVRYGELGLKGDNQGYFKSTLINNIKRTVGSTGGQKLAARIIVSS